jgi:putative acetyltransferase
VRKDTIVIREIQPQDNAPLEAVIRACFHEFKIPLKGTAYEDPETKQMFESYQNNNAIYYVIEKNGEVLGGAGVKPLKDFKGNICELQKMYFSPKIRGKGFGKKMFETCLNAAKTLAYEKCYIESAPQLKAAIHVYESFGFKHLEGPLGNTGHSSCSVWMIKDLCN